MVCMYFFFPKASDLFWEVDGGHTGRTGSLGAHWELRSSAHSTGKHMPTPHPTISLI